MRKIILITVFISAITAAVCWIRFLRKYTAPQEGWFTTYTTMMFDWDDEEKLRYV